MNLENDVKQWEIIRYDNTYGLTTQTISANTVYDALVATGNLTDFEIISIKLITVDRPY